MAGLVCCRFDVFSLGAISLILGLAKVYEPETTLALDDKGLTYFHRRGKVSIDWNNIQRVDIPRVTNGLDTIELSYLGIKLKHLNPILDNISLRLATGLLTEQRPLLVTAASQDADLATLETYLGAEFGPLVIEGSLSWRISYVWASLRDVRYAFRVSLVYSP